MTNVDAELNLVTLKAMILTMLSLLVGETTATEIISGSTTITAATGIVGDYSTVKGTFDGAPTTFVDTPANIDALDDVMDAFVAIEVPDPAVLSGDAYDALQLASPEV